MNQILLNDTEDGFTAESLRINMLKAYELHRKLIYISISL